MKLHLPLSLRSALLAACAFGGLQNAAAESYVLENLCNEGTLDVIKDIWTGEVKEVVAFRGGADYIEVNNLYSSSLEENPTPGVYLRFDDVNFQGNKIDMRSGVMIGGGTENPKTVYPPSYGGALHVYIKNPTYNDKDTLYSAPVLFEDCKDISMTNNGIWVASLWGIDDYDRPVRLAEGGAVYVQAYPKGDGTLVTALEFKNNDKVVFRGNYLTDGKTYELNAISTKNAPLTFKTKAGQTVECYDSIHVDVFSDHITLMINGDEIDRDDSYTGTVLFSGIHTKEDLGKLKPNYTEEELLASRTVSATTMRVYNGTLKLEEVYVTLESHGWGPTDSPVQFASSEKAVVQMVNATLNTKHVVSESLGFLTYGIVNLPTADFSGSNTIEATWLNANNGTWTFHVAGENKEKALLNIAFDTMCRVGAYEFDREFNTNNQTFVIDTDANLAKGKYKLLTYNDAAGSWYGIQNVTIQGAYSTKIGENDVYLLYESDDVYTLWFDFGQDVAEEPGIDDPKEPGADIPTKPEEPSVTPEEPPVRGETMLTWNSANGTWKEGAGDWNGSVDDLTFHKNDSVVFDSEATVNVGGPVLPKEMLVSNESGVVEFQSVDGGQIAGSTSITKTGEGELILGMANTYTGGTYIKAGIVTVNHAKALGFGDVYMTGGTLDMVGRAVDNTIHASGEVAIVNGLSFTGNMELAKAALNYSNFTIAEGAALSISETTLNEYCNIVMSAGSALEVDALTLSNGSVLTLEGAEVKGNITVVDGSLIVTAEQSIDGDLALEGGSVLLSKTLDVQGSLTSSGVVDVELQEQVMKTLGSTGKTTIFTAGNVDGLNAEDLILNQLRSARGYEVRKEDKSVCVELKSVDLTWKSDGSTRLWGVGLGNEWGTDDSDDKTFHNFDRVVFESAGEVNIEGSVMPGSIHVTGEQDTIFTCEGIDAPAEAGITPKMTPRNTAGEITGSGTLTKEDSGTLRIETDNSNYTGDIIVKGGTLEVGHENALGHGTAVSIQNAGFDGGDFVITGREISLSGASSIKKANNVKKVRFEGGSTISSDSFKLSAGRTLTIGRGDTVRYEGDEFVFQGGGMLALEGAMFDLSGAKSITFETNQMDGNLGGNLGNLDDAWDKVPDSLKGSLGALKSKLEAVKDMIENQGENGLGVTVIDLRGRDDIMFGGDYDLLRLDLDEEGIEGKFVAYLDDLSMALYQEITYENGVLHLHINMTEIDASIVGSLNRNQRAVFSALHLMGTLMEAKDELAVLSKELFRQDISVAEAKAVLDKLSGQELATAMTSQIEGNMAHLRRLRANMGSGQRVDKEGNNAVYVLGYDGQNHVDENVDGPGIKRTEWGGTLGYERKVREESLIGFALTSGSATVKPTGGESYDEDDLRVDFYVVGSLGNGWQSVMSVGFGKHEYDITRRMGAYTSKASLEGYSVNLQQEVSYTKKLNEQSSLQPFVSLEVSANVINAFTEEGAGSASLEGTDSATSAIDITLGARYIRTFAVGERTGSMSLQAAIVASAGESATETELHFVGAPHRRFTVSAASTDAVGFNLGASVQVPLSQNAAIIGTANGILRSGSEEMGASVGLRVSF